MTRLLLAAELKLWRLSGRTQIGVERDAHLYERHLDVEPPADSSHLASPPKARFQPVVRKLR